MRYILAVMMVAGLAACEPAGTAGTGVGFSNYDYHESQRRAREAALAGAPTSQSMAGGGNSALARDALAAVGAPLPAANAAPVITPAPTPGSAQISDEQDFSAVAARETIESDAARIAAQREAYQVIEPGALPQRQGGNAATIVNFALSTTNSVGQPVYRRMILGSGQARQERACGRFPSPDLAQEEFLRRGGPQRDALGLDPDGDGFACSWDPAPFRLAARR